LKIALHNIKELLENEDLDILDIENLGCLYEGTDLLSHEIEGECIYCDYKKLELKEKREGLNWLDCTEYWDFCDYWNNKYK